MINNTELTTPTLDLANVFLIRQSLFSCLLLWQTEQRG